MFREINYRHLHWSQKTFTAIRTSEADLYEKRLRALPNTDVFDDSCSVTDAEKLFAASFFAVEENVADTLLTAEDIRKKVLRHFPSELSLCSVPEHEMLVRLIFTGGSTSLKTDQDICTAWSLARRLWIRIEPAAEDENLRITLPPRILTTAVIILAGDTHRDVRSCVETVDDSVSRTLYLYGFMQVSGPMGHLKQLVYSLMPDIPNYIYDRFFQSSFTCFIGHSGNFLLLHPALAEPESFIVPGDPMEDAVVNMDPDSIQSVNQQLEAQEQPLYDQLFGLIHNACRPELPPEDAVEDLILLSKQNVPYSGLTEALNNMLAGIASGDMLLALRNIHERIPRWISMSSARLQ